MKNTKCAGLENAADSIFAILEQLAVVMKETKEIFSEQGNNSEPTRLICGEAYPERFDTKRALANSQVLLQLSELLMDKADLLETNLREEWMQTCNVKMVQHQPGSAYAGRSYKISGL